MSNIDIKALTEAAFHGHIKEIGRLAALLPPGSKIAFPEGDNTALHVAAFAGQTDSIMRLLPICDPNARNDSGETALFAAASRGSACAIRALIDGGRDPNLPNEDLQTPLHRAAYQGQLSSALALIPFCDPEARDIDGMTPLMLAACENYPEIAEALLARCDPDARDGDGRNALQIACLSGSAECVPALAMACDHQGAAGLCACPDTLEALTETLAAKEKMMLDGHLPCLQPSGPAPSV